MLYSYAHSIVIHGMIYIHFCIIGHLEEPTDLECIARGNDVVCDGTQRYSRNLTKRNYEHLRSYDIDPEIRFYACVTNLTCGETMLRPACQITRLPFTLYGQNNRPFRVTVTPLNNSNATPAEFEGTCTQHVEWNQVYFVTDILSLLVSMMAPTIVVILAQ